MAEEQKFNGLTRKEFLALPMEERRRLLLKSAEKAAKCDACKLPNCEGCPLSFSRCDDCDREDCKGCEIGKVVSICETCADGDKAPACPARHTETVRACYNYRPAYEPIQPETVNCPNKTDNSINTCETCGNIETKCLNLAQTHCIGYSNWIPKPIPAVSSTFAICETPCIHNSEIPKCAAKKYNPTNACYCFNPVQSSTVLTDEETRFITSNGFKPYYCYLLPYLDEQDAHTRHELIRQGWVNGKEIANALAECGGYPQGDNGLVVDKSKWFALISLMEEA
jgi:hypothetical protein